MIARRTLLVAGLLAGCAPAWRPVARLEEWYGGEQGLYEAARREGMVVSFNTGPSWANWAALFSAFRARYPGVELGQNDLGSGAAVAALAGARAKPQADTCYFFASSAVDAEAQGLLAEFTPERTGTMPAALASPTHRWFSPHSLDLALLVNRRAVVRSPRGWRDLLHPDYAGSVVYLDPRTTGLGQVAVMAAAEALGRGPDDLATACGFFGRLHQAGIVLRVTPSTPYGQFVKGEIPIWIGYASDGLRARHHDGLGDIVDVVTPVEGGVAAPYAIGLVEGAPHPNAGRLWLNFVFSVVGQSLFAQGHVRPALTQVEVSVTMLDVTRSAELRPAIADGWRRATLGVAR